MRQQTNNDEQQAPTTDAHWSLHASRSRADRNTAGIVVLTVMLFPRGDVVFSCCLPGRGGRLILIVKLSFGMPRRKRDRVGTS